MAETTLPPDAEYVSHSRLLDEPTYWDATVGRLRLYAERLRDGGRPERWVVMHDPEGACCVREHIAETERRLAFATYAPAGQA